jgi:hypothetical protein
MIIATLSLLIGNYGASHLEPRTLAQLRRQVFHIVDANLQDLQGGAAPNGCGQRSQRVALKVEDC